MSCLQLKVLDHLRAASSSRCRMMRVSAVRLTACMAPDIPLPDCRTTPPALLLASPLQRWGTPGAAGQLRVHCTCCSASRHCCCCDDGVRHCTPLMPRVHRQGHLT